MIALALALFLAAAASPDTNQTIRKLSRNPAVAAASKRIRDDDALTLREQIELAEIPAPGEAERTRAESFRDRLKALGMTDASIDGIGNVVAWRRGSGKGPLLIVSAHLDTVFSKNDSVKVTETDGRYHGRGIADDARGLAAILSVVRSLEAARLKTVGDILFVGTVGEEGFGNLRGAKAVLRDHPGTDAFITVEPAIEGNVGIGVGATGSRRWIMTFKGPGGHSFADFGRPSAIHAAGRAIANIDAIRTATDPKTTFNVGVVAGGTSVNTIAAEASMQIDIRSNKQDTLMASEREILAAIDRGVQETNARWNGPGVQLERRLAGDRPAGATDPESALVRMAVAATAAVKGERPKLMTESTDANAAIVLGIPAIVIEGGGLAGSLHSADEWFEARDAWRGPQILLLTTLGLVGVEGVVPASLPDRPVGAAK